MLDEKGRHLHRSCIPELDEPATFYILISDPVGTSTMLLASLLSSL